MHISNEMIFFAGFLILILFLLFLDLGVFSKNSHVVSLKESVSWTLLWVSLSIGFYFFIRFHGDLIHGIKDLDQLKEIIALHKHPINIEGMPFDRAISVFNKNLSLQYLTGYIIEYSLSLDNVFVILLIFLSFNVPEKYYKRVLFWGILGAIVMRFIFIFTLSAIITKFAWVMYIFGLFLVFTAVKMFNDFLRKKKEKIDVEHHIMVRLTRKFFPVHPKFEGDKFWIRKNKILYVTPLFIVLMVIEFSDLIFAVDSVPAIFTITQDPFIVYTSNIFAILGLRSLYFVLAAMVHRFHYLKYALSLVLIYVGGKIFVQQFIGKIDPAISLAITIAILLGGILLSLWKTRKVPDVSRKIAIAE